MLKYHSLKKGGRSTMVLKNTVKCTVISICEPKKNPQGPGSSCLLRTEFYSVKQKSKYTATKQVHSKDVCALS